MNPDIRASLSAILAYLQADEARHYQECSPKDRKDHIYRHVVKIRKWLRRQTPRVPINTDIILEALRDYRRWWNEDDEDAQRCAEIDTAIEQVKALPTEEATS